MIDPGLLGSWMPVWVIGLAVLAAKTALVVGGVLLLLRFFPGLSASTRYQFLFSSIVVVLLLPLLTAFLPSWNTLPRLADPPEVLQQVMATPPAAAASPSIPGNDALGDGERAMPVARNDQAGTSPSFATSSTWIVLFSFWLAGLFVLGMRILLAHQTVLKLASQAVPLEHAEWEALLADCAKQIGLKRKPELRIHPEPIMPMTQGILRSVILLPLDAQSWPIERRRNVLLHELAHVKRADLFLEAVSLFACVLQWFNPLLWRAHRKLIIERERACDDMVLRSGANPSDYADNLLKTAVEFQQTPVFSPGMARRSDIETRLVSILDSSRSRGTITRAGALLVLGLGLCIGVPLSTLAFVDKDGATNPAQLEALSSSRDAAGNHTEPSPEALKLAQELRSANQAQRRQAAREINALRRNDPLLLELSDMLFFITQSDTRLFEDYATFYTDNPQETPSLKTLMANLDDDFVVNRAAAAQALGGFSDPEVVFALTDALQDDNWHVREWAARSLGSIRDPAGIDSLIAALEDESGEVREWAARSLGNIGDESAVDGLVFGLSDADSDVREWSARSLGSIGSPLAVDGLIESLQDEQENVREWAVRSLGQIGDRRAMDPLSELLDDDSSNIREWSMRALEQIAVR